MDISFYKLVALRNDFILINATGDDSLEPAALPRLAVRMCRRTRGVGAKGLIYLTRTTNRDFELRFHLPSGDLGFPLHDASLAAARFVFDSGLAGRESVAFHTPAGTQTVEFPDSTFFRVSLGAPKRRGTGEPFREDQDDAVVVPVLFGGQSRPVVPLSLERPAAVHFHEDLAKREIRAMDREFAKAEGFADMARIYARVFSRDELAITLGKLEYHDTLHVASCAAVAGVAVGLNERQVEVRVGRERCFVHWRRTGDEVVATGNARYIYAGDYFFDETPLPSDDSMM